MSATLFAVPLPSSRCLSPLPHPGPAAFKRGDMVAWSDGELGLVTAATEHAVCVFWTYSQHGWYPLHGGAVENITVLEREAA
jgi:hypothetical protein